jgi:hypothetical protein
MADGIYPPLLRDPPPLVDWETELLTREREESGWPEFYVIEWTEPPPRRYPRPVGRLLAIMGCAAAAWIVVGGAFAALLYAAIRLARWEILGS